VGLFSNRRSPTPVACLGRRPEVRAGCVAGAV